MPKGEIATKPDAPTLTDFAFGLWYQDKERKVPFFFDTPITQNLTLYAGWNTPDHFTVRFHPNGGTHNIADQTIALNGTATKPTPPLHLKTDLTFINWYKDRTFLTPFDFDTETITQNTIIYAGWGYTVTFALEGGTGNTSTNPQTILIGSLATKPATAPTKTDATFGLWYKDSALTKAFNFDTETITKDTPIYAGWNATVTFNTNDGSTINPITVLSGRTVTKPTDPIKSNRAFGRWYKDNALTTPFDFDTEKITLNITLHAGWSFIWSTVAAGYDYTVTTKKDGTLWTWGKNAEGQLGLGDKTNKHVPTQVGTAVDWKAVYAKYTHTVGIQTDNTLWAWGKNKSKQLGLKDTNDRTSPTQIGTTTWKAINVIPDGHNTYMVWGSVSPLPVTWKAVAVGYSHTVGIQTDGTLYIWGPSAQDGRLGLGLNLNTSQWVSPTKIGTATWKAVAAGDRHTVGIKTDGTLWAWGNNASLIGVGTSPPHYYNRPQQVGKATNWSTVDAWEDHTVGIQTDGTLWTWGWNNYGQLGLGNSISQTSPMQVGSDKDWSMIVTGKDHTVGIKTDGTLWAWGRNHHGQLGTRDKKNKYVPTQVGNDKDWSTVAAGRMHTVGIKTNGAFWTWGSNYYGQLGTGDTTDRNSPTLVKEDPTTP